MNKCIFLTKPLVQNQTPICGKDKVCPDDQEKNLVFMTSVHWFTLAITFIVLSGIVGILLVYVD
jgi:hypothetical protein